jgi:hypothetical protein
LADINFVAILYVNRSGSTLFSRMLSDSSPEACILPELGVPVKLLLMRRSGRHVSGDALYRLVKEDPRSEALQLSDRSLRTLCSNHSSEDLPKFFHALAVAVVGRPVQTVVFKLETLLYVADEAAAAFPALRFIHIHRDPRAVVNSMMRAPVPEKPGFNMARGSLVYAATHWGRYVSAVKRLASTQPVVNIRYEDLGSGADISELADMKLFLRSERHGTSPYRVAALDNPLHPHVYHEFDPALTEAWRRQLTKREISAIEMLCAVPMRELGYLRALAAPYLKPALLPFYASHIWAMARHSWRTLAVYLTGPNPLPRLRTRIRLLFANRLS